MPHPEISQVVAARTGVAGGLAGMLGGATLMFPTPGLDKPGFLLFNSCNVAAFVLVIITTVALWRLGVAGGGRLGRVGLVATSAALLGFAVVEFATRYDSTIGESIHPITVPMLALGMTATGIAVVRAGHWRGWVRATPLLCGLVPLAVELPTFVLFGPNSVVIALTWGTWVLLGLAELSTSISTRRQAEHPEHRLCDSPMGG